MHEKLKEFIESTQEGITQDMKNNGRTLKALLMFDLEEEDENGKTKIGMMPLPDEADGPFISGLVQSLRPQFDVVAMIAESWKNANKDMAPSEDPDREEVVILAVYTKEKNYLYMSDMSRISDEQVIMGDWSDMNEEGEAQGRLAQPHRNPPSWN